MTSTETKQAPELEIPFTLDAKQIEAINLCCDRKNRVVGVTGAAGSGKTTILKTVYWRLKEAGYMVVLCAPTGKAAKRIYEATGIEAMTVHRLLEYTMPGEIDPKTGKPAFRSYPKRTRLNPLEFDFILADEYAMVNREMHRNLFDALSHGACVRCFGDINQLQPIEEFQRDKELPSVFNEMLDNPKLCSVRLESIYRQGKDSGILLNLQQILKGRVPTRNEQWDIKFAGSKSPVDVLRDLVLDALEEGIDFRSIDNQIITPQKKSWVGTIKLNQMLQGLFFSKLDPSAVIPRHGKWQAKPADEPEYLRVFVGDKVVITQNNYDLGVFNGETGTIIEISHDDEIVIDFGDREQAIPPSMLVVNKFGKTVEIDPRKDIDLAYALTTHKMQGSEVKRVVYVLDKATAYMQNRKNFYTACSRGREHVTVITDQKSLSLSTVKKG